MTPDDAEVDITILSGRWKAALPEAAREAMLGGIPLARPATPQDIAGAVLFQSSAYASYVTGQLLLVDGGASVKFPLPVPVDDAR